VAFTVVFGLVFTLASSFVSMALLVRTSFGRVPHAITFLPAPLVLFNAWMSAWFVFECLRQFALTSMTPASALRLVAFVFLVAALLSVAFLYACVSVVHQFLGGKTSRRLRRGAKHLALVYSALLIVGWSAYHFNADSGLFTRLRSMLAMVGTPLALSSWLWLLNGAGNLADAAWRGKVQRLSRQYVALFAALFVAAAVRDRLEPIGPALPLAIDVFFVLAYTLLTVLWVESVQEKRSPAAAHQAMP
jgi:hypothetical protein